MRHFFRMGAAAGGQRWPRAVAVATGRHAGSSCGSGCLRLADCLLPA